MDNSRLLLPENLRELVFDYLCHHSYTSTAQAFARENASRSRETDVSMDGTTSKASFLSDEALSLIERRKEIQLLILAGRIDEATQALNAYFPSVLGTSDTPDDLSSPSPPKRGKAYFTSQSAVNPIHLSLNLRMQAFIEATRTVELEYPFDPDRPHSRLKHLDDPAARDDHQNALLHKAQKLYSEVESLQTPKDKELFRKELTNVGGLLAYREPEESPLAKLLSQERREAVAEKINSGILYRLNLPAISTVELSARYTTAILTMLHERRIELPASSDRPAGLEFPPYPEVQIPTRPKQGSDKPDKETPQTIPAFDLRQFLQSR